MPQEGPYGRICPNSGLSLRVLPVEECEDIHPEQKGNIPLEESKGEPSGKQVLS